MARLTHHHMAIEEMGTMDMVAVMETDGEMEEGDILNDRGYPCVKKLRLVVCPLSDTLDGEGGNSIFKRQQFYEVNLPIKRNITSFFWVVCN